MWAQFSIEERILLEWRDLQAKRASHEVVPFMRMTSASIYLDLSVGGACLWSIINPIYKKDSDLAD